MARFYREHMEHYANQTWWKRMDRLTLSPAVVTSHQGNNCPPPCRPALPVSGAPPAVPWCPAPAGLAALRPGPLRGSVAPRFGLAFSLVPVFRASGARGFWPVRVSVSLSPPGTSQGAPGSVRFHDLVDTMSQDIVDTCSGGVHGSCPLRR